MGMIDSLDLRQQQIVTMIRDGVPLDPRQRVSAAALVAAGFLRLVEGKYELSKTGCALFETRDIEQQAVSDFHLNDPVEVSLWYRHFAYHSSVSWAHEWVAGIIVDLSATRLQVRFLDGVLGSHLPGKVRHAKNLH